MNEKHYKIFVINPGSTSTKLAYFEDENKIFETNVFHDAPELAKFPTINDQLPYRMRVILDFLDRNHIDLHGVDAIVGRGGSSYPVQSGVYEMTDQLLSDIVSAKGGVNHPSNLGCQLAKELQNIYGGRVFMVDSPSTDEFCPEARFTGISGLCRGSHLHTLNLKGTIRMHCKKQGLRYEDGNFIVCHIDGGISVTAHRRGEMIDGNDAAGGEGPFTPTRSGTLNILDACRYFQDKNGEEIRKICTTAGGFTSYFATSDSNKIHELVLQGDKKANAVWDAWIYTINKAIGSMAAVLCGEVDGIVLGGGLLRFDDVCEKLRSRCEWIAPLYFYPGEVEHEAMADGALRVLKGEEELKVYEGKPLDFENL